MHKLFILLIRGSLTYFLISFLCCDPAVGQSQKFIEVIPGNAIPDNPEMSASNQMRTAEPSSFCPKQEEFPRT
jgi:hypothetical protein